MSKEKYYIIYKIDKKEDKVFTIVESEKVAMDWCNRNPEYFYIERTCE